MATGYVGRFAPSPTGALHAGSVAAALASWLDARAHGGQWLVRIEDVDAARCVPGADRVILQQLAALGLHPDAAPLRQSTRGDAYQAALDRLIEAGLAYPCACSRSDILAALAERDALPRRHEELVYPGTCRSGLNGRPARAWRFRLPQDASVDWHDRRLGAQRQDVATRVGDFVLKRADGQWAYQIAVVVDDADQGVTDVVRGVDLADNTPRQLLLMRALGLPAPRWLHTPLVLGENGEKLSKQNGAQPVDTARPLDVLNAAAAALGLPAQAGTPPQAMAAWVGQWRDLYNLSAS
ncbi:tRNA glutamyl-Q(34) synthetase GluQRS [Variovorax sp. VNK109]|uniref:tRNA glutamyl-Q(34) synthetase GluQRS n=1 Tax=Variovorax sp. VNK109 TaxID=3400919 RepID=UPI003C020693